ncbi:MAG: GTPase Era [Lachnospiraceae bacterium]|nr:GTPase Era [Lachnospiraceae bacterium]
MTQTGDDFRTGVIALIGRPNVGKSTLMNRLIGMKVAITSVKPQTTRGRIRTVVTEENAQMIFLDSPGIHEAKNRLGERMMRVAADVKKDADVILWLLDIKNRIGEEERQIGDDLSHARQPVIVVLNKADGLSGEEMREAVRRVTDCYSFDGCLAVSALKGDQINELKRAIIEKLPFGPPLYDEDELTDMPEREIVAEIIREKALRFLDDEVPHGIAVVTETMRWRTKKPENGKQAADGEAQEICDIEAVLICERESHKGIIIGKNGRMIREIGRAARADIEKLLDCHVNLQMFVKVRKDWRDDVRQLKNFGLWTTER